MGNQSSATHSYKYKESKDMIGNGAFGKTFRARRAKDGTLKEPVAIQAVPKNPAFADPASVVGIAASVIRLSNYSRNLLRCVDFYDDKDFYYIVTEWCSHGDLASYLIKVKPFCITKIDIALQLVEGMDYLHSQLPSIIHAHLKPGNILIQVENFKDTVKIAEYGFTSFLPTCESFARFYLEKDPGLYCPPEYFLPSGKFSPAVDVFAVGLVVYMILKHSGNPNDACPKTELHEHFSIDFTNIPLGKLMTRDLTQFVKGGPVVMAKGDDPSHYREIICLINDMLRPCAEDRLPLKVFRERLRAIAGELNIRPRDKESVSSAYSSGSSPPRIEAYSGYLAPRGRESSESVYLTPRGCDKQYNWRVSNTDSENSVYDELYICMEPGKEEDSTATVDPVPPPGRVEHSQTSHRVRTQQNEKYNSKEFGKPVTRYIRDKSGALPEYHVQVDDFPRDLPPPPSVRKKSVQN